MKAKKIIVMTIFATFFSGKLMASLDPASALKEYSQGQRIEIKQQEMQVDQKTKPSIHHPTEIERPCFRYHGTRTSPLFFRFEWVRTNPLNNNGNDSFIDPDGK
jgi:hypothetical protein